MKFGFLFPGQGSQFVGMGKDIYYQHNEVRQIYDIAEDIFDFSLKKISFEGPEDELRKTRTTQPAIFVNSIAIFRLISDMNIHPHALAGHSLGEYSALVAAGTLSFQEGLQLVKLRSELMQHSGEKYPGTMAAIIGLPAETVIAICKEASSYGLVEPANFNSPGQVVISGTVEGVRNAMDLAKDKKARTVTQLIVSGAFHSPLMKEALEELTYALDETDFQDPKIPVYANVTARHVSSGEEIRELLKRQLLSPVLWQNLIENMIADGTEKFYEVGPSKVLSGLIRRINRDVPCISVGNEPDLLSLELGEVDGKF